MKHGNTGLGHGTNGNPQQDIEQQETKEKLQSFYKELCSLGEINAAREMMFFLDKVDKELKHAQSKYIILESIGYDIVAICAEQSEYRSKYEEKINRLFSDD